MKSWETIAPLPNAGLRPWSGHNPSGGGGSTQIWWGGNCRPLPHAGYDPSYIQTQAQSLTEKYRSGLIVLYLQQGGSLEHASVFYSWKSFQGCFAFEGWEIPRVPFQMRLLGLHSLICVSIVGAELSLRGQWF